MPFSYNRFMYSDLSEKLLLRQGIFKDDLLQTYRNMSTYYDFSMYTLERAITKVLKLSLGKGFSWKMVPRGPWTGDSRKGQAYQVNKGEKKYFFKISSAPKDAIGSLLGKALLDEFPQPHLKFVEYIDHGLLKCKDEPLYFFSITAEADGENLVTSLQQGQTDSFLLYSKTLGKLLAQEQNNNPKQASDREKFDSTIVRSHKKILRHIESSKALPDHLKEISDQALKKYFPHFNKLHQAYIENPQTTSLLHGFYRIGNLRFSSEKETLTIFDTALLSLYSGPGSIPRIPIEFGITDFAAQLYFAKIDFNLEDSFVKNCQDTFLHSFYGKLEHPQMSREGFQLHFLLRNFIYIEKALKRVASGSEDLNKFEAFMKKTLPMLEDDHPIYNQYLLA